MISFYSLTSYQPYNTQTTMKQNRPRLLSTPTTNRKQFYALIFFIISFLFASWYAPEIQHEILMQQPPTQTK